MKYKCKVCGTVFEDANVCPMCGSTSEFFVEFDNDLNQKQVEKPKETLNLPKNEIVLKYKSTKNLLLDLINVYDKIKDRDLNKSLVIKKAILDEIEVFMFYSSMANKNEEIALVEMLFRDLKESEELDKRIGLYKGNYKEYAEKEQEIIARIRVALK
jgi:uncharacterized membrane-anchored protein YhcB (DUF1043 family)